MPALLAAFACSFLVTMLVVHATKTRGALLLDHDTSGPQKFHTRPVARVGGVGIFAGLIAATVPLAWTTSREAVAAAALLLVCSLPAFAGGLVEDLTKRVRPLYRLAATAVSALLAAWLLGSLITRTDIPGLDWVVSLGAGATLLTVFAVAGIANSINIIDGFNGLATMCVVIMLAALAYVAFQVGDSFIGALALAGIGAVMGFFLWNFPAGLIFLGDGGAYFLGFFVAELSILLLVRNPSVSPLFPLLVCIYPVFETLFSIYRRRFIRSVPPSMPDGIHLHSLIYRRLMRWAVGDRSARALTRSNSMTSPFLWLLCMLSVVPAVLFWHSTPWNALFLCLFATVYVMLYRRIVRFKVPRWMRALVPRSPLVRPAQVHPTDRSRPDVTS
ncbi:MAG: glycosyltransferase family 4 protein [Betaproteobacteria bacterium]|nr:glycosyltransferase family 4 protein [Betaproteobacteria bacterium]